MNKGIEAYVTEFTCDGGQSWEIGAIAWFPHELVKHAEQELPFPYRITHVKITTGDGPMDHDELKRIVKEAEILDNLFK